MQSVKPAWQWTMLAVASLALALACRLAALPAALLLGPMLCAIGFGLAGATVRVPRLAFMAAQTVIGLLVARAITASIVLAVLRDWPVMLLVVSTTVVASGCVGWALTRFGTLPGSTAAWGTAPGGASAMVAMSEEFGADPRLVALMQYVRVVAIALSASLVARLVFGSGHAVAPPQLVPAHPDLLAEAGSLLATLAIGAVGLRVAMWVRIPAGTLLVPMFLGAVLHAGGMAEITLPEWLLGMAYAAIGWSVGLRFNREVTRASLHAMPEILIGTAGLLGLCALSGWAMTHLIRTDALTAYLATSPGGLDTVSIIAVGSDADVPFILALQTLRLVVVIVTGPPLARLIARQASLRRGRTP
jgi:membrane AbrB-like protein